MVVLTQDQINTFLDDGVLVVDDVLTSDELARAQSGLKESLKRRCVQPDKLQATGHHLAHLSSTNGSGGVLDIFYDEWKMKLATHAGFFAITQQLWQATYGIDSDRCADFSKGYAYTDRIGYRLPSELAENIGKNMTTSKKKRPIQRSLTPHLDCCPETFGDKKTKWRPIQSFLSLSDTLKPNHGGFEAVKGFHREFQAWSQDRPKSQRNGKELPAPCLGDYTHIRPQEDKKIFQRIKHVPCRAGSAVFWDVRIPHANSYRHEGHEPRAVVYCSFLPDVDLNRRYARDQLQQWKRRQNPTDQWIESGDEDETIPLPESMQLSNLARKLLALEEW